LRSAGPALAGIAALALAMSAVGAGSRAPAPEQGSDLCEGCHSPRTSAGTVDPARRYDGGWSQGWYAPPLNANSLAVEPWTAEELHAYLRTGLSLTHAAAAGPMGNVVRGLAASPETDVRATAARFASLMAPAPRAHAPPPSDNAEAAARAHPEGAAMFAGACAGCHEAGAPMMLEGRPALQLGTPLHEASPRDTIAIVLRGLEPPAGPSGPYMPAFADDFSDAQLAELAAYLHARYGPEAAWPRDLNGEVASARREAR
jgi:nicotinate dehydrogenase subunit B